MSSDTVHSTSQSYERLRSGEIRLLRIFPSEFNGASIDGSLEVFTLVAAPDYTAISYAWGDRRSISSISINGEATPITTSLLHALVTLRKRDEPIWIWVDALSINQCDVDELNSQVHIMDTIYSQAHTVAMCLGPECRNSEQAFKVMKAVRERWNPENIFHSMVSRERSQILSVVRLFERSYWKRLWVMQEIFHAKRVTVYCGSDYMALDDISIVCDYFKYYSGTIENWARTLCFTPQQAYHTILWKYYASAGAS
ncbi:Heterokaryon incompatibility protein 6 [Colletotrichum gloeosporioides]|uniref:Heterokaryon incompatibility protein 6 n=1 Tax=Colletotrichum gloeosporioides TaxID=474922 RepID=A0A8H4CVY6_COLGL|nr:Heterokaryon incompatibility protein 6 [Colletotrichum gloeosporioides]KAF3811076.1 Heterokaryon incompatibility protein 6 [Colletotrichum gloeosporioides]